MRRTFWHQHVQKSDATWGTAEKKIRDNGVRDVILYKKNVCRIRRLNSNLTLSRQSSEFDANANMLLSCRIGCCYPKIRKSVQRYRDRRESKLFVEFPEYSGHDDTFDETRYQESNHSHLKERKNGNAPSQRVSVTKPGIVYLDYFDDPHPSSDEEGMTRGISVNDAHFFLCAHLFAIWLRGVQHFFLRARPRISTTPTTI